MLKRWTGAVLALAVLCCGAPAEDHPETAKYANIKLWPGVAPGSEDAPKQELYQTYNDRGSRRFWAISQPMMTAFFAAKPNGASVLVIPGGGYRAVYFDSGVDVARWFNAIGVDAYVLKYRLPDDGHHSGYKVPVEDAQRAMRLIRSGVWAETAGHKLDPARIGVMGMSAGGNLAMVLGLHHDRKVYDPVDDKDSISARPDFMILGYAVLPSTKDLPVEDRSQASKLYRFFPVSERIDSKTPPAFIYHGAEDKDVAPAQSRRLSEQMTRAGVPNELHILPDAGHGFGLRYGWPDLCAKWLAAQGIIPKPAE